MTEKEWIIFGGLFYAAVCPLLIEWLVTYLPRVRRRNELDIKIETKPSQNTTKSKTIELDTKTKWRNDYLTVNVTDNEYNENNENDPDFLEY